MDAAYIDGGGVQAQAGHHRHRLAHRVAACKGRGERSVASVAVRALRCAAGLWLACAWAAAAAAPHVPEAAPMPVVAPGPDQARPNIRPLLNDEDRQAALQEGKRLRALAPPVAASAPKPAPASTSTSTSTSKRGAPPPPTAEAQAEHPAPPKAQVDAKKPAPSSAPASPVADNSVAYALVTEVTRSRLASELRQQLMSASPAVSNASGGSHAELMQVSNGWRAVVWPFATEGEAEKARQSLAASGIRTEVVKF